MSPFTLYNIVMGGLASLGLIYLLYLEAFVSEYGTVLGITIAGLLLYALGSPIISLVAPTYIHLLHGVATILVIVGLYNPLHNEVRTDHWANLLWADVQQMRDTPEWMTPLDDRILELFHSADLVLSPSIIAYNLDYSREQVNRRLGNLHDNGFVERIERGKYRLTTQGEQYLHAARSMGDTPEEQ